MIYAKLHIRIFVDFEQFFKGIVETTTRYAVCGLCFHLVKNYGKRFFKFSPPPPKIKYVHYTFTT
jgi:hypothetical protein